MAARKSSGRKAPRPSGRAKRTTKQKVKKPAAKKTAAKAELETVAIGDLSPPPEIDFVIATATKRERDTMLQHLAPMSGRARIVKTPWEESTYYIGICGRYACALVMCEAGSGGRAGSGQHVGDAIERWKPRGVIMPGIAFGKGGKDQVLGDVLISTRVIPYDHTRRGKKKIPRAPNPEAGQTLLDRARNLHWSWTPEGERASPRDPIFGPVLSGENLVDDSKFKAQLFKQWPEAIGGEMELAGVYAAAERRRVEWILIKAICDWGENKAKISNQPLAARNACACVAALLSEPGLGPENFTRGGTASPSAPNAMVVTSAQQFALSTALQAIRATQRDHRAACDELAQLLGPVVRDQESRFSDAQAGQASLLEAKVRATAESLLNAYNDAAGKFLRGGFPAAEFREALGNEICELIEAAESDEADPPSKRLVPRGQSPFSAIWEAFDQFRPVFRPLRIHDVTTLTDRPITFEIEPSRLGQSNPLPLVVRGAPTEVLIRNEGNTTVHGCSAAAVLDDGREVPLPWLGGPDINRGESHRVRLCILALDEHGQRLAVVGPPDIPQTYGPFGRLNGGAVVYPAPALLSLTIRITSRDTPPHLYRQGLQLGPASDTAEQRCPRCGATAPPIQVETARGRETYCTNCRPR